MASLRWVDSLQSCYSQHVTVVFVLLALLLAPQLPFGAHRAIASESNDISHWQKVSKAATAAFHEGRTQQAEALFRQALQLARKSGKKDLIGNSLCNLATAVYERGRIEESISLCRQAISLLEKDPTLKEDLYVVVRSLGGIYENSGRTSEAVESYKQIIAVMNEDSSCKPMERIPYLYLLADLYEKQGKLQQVLSLYSEALAIEEKARVEPLVLVNAISRLANINYKLGHFKEAESLNKRALAIEEKAGKISGCLYNNLGLIYTALGRFSQAESMFNCALKSLENRPDKTEDLGQALGNLACLHMDRFEPKLAEPLYRRALQIKEKAVGLDSVELLTELSNLGNCYRSQGKLAQAQESFDRALRLVKESALTEFQKAEFFNNLALLYVAQRKYSQAETLYKRAVAALEATLGKEHPDLVRMRHNYADLLNETKHSI